MGAKKGQLLHNELMQSNPMFSFLDPLRLSCICMHESTAHGQLSPGGLCPSRNKAGLHGLQSAVSKVCQKFWTLFDPLQGVFRHTTSCSRPELKDLGADFCLIIDWAAVARTLCFTTLLCKVGYTPLSFGRQRRSLRNMQ